MKKRTISVLLCLMLMLNVAGCMPAADTYEVNDLLDEIDELEDNVTDLETQLADEKALNEANSGNENEIATLNATIETLEAEIEENVSMSTETIPAGYVNYYDHYHPTEVYEDSLYCIYENADYSNRLLIAFSLYEPAKVLMEGASIDFRGNTNGDLFAVENSETLTIMTSEGEILHTFSYSELQGNATYTQVQIEGWSSDSDTLWISLKETYASLAYIEIDVVSGAMTIYEDEQNTWHHDDIVLNYDTGWLAYSDHPVFFDIDSQQEFNDGHEIISLYIYNLETAEETLIASEEKAMFSPEWDNYDPYTLYYNNGYEYGEYTIN